MTDSRSVLNDFMNHETFILKINIDNCLYYSRSMWDLYLSYMHQPHYPVCESSLCGSHGNCISMGPFDFTCQCEVGYTGSTCEVNIDDCVSVTCPCNSVCVDGVNDFECTCLPGFGKINGTTAWWWYRQKVAMQVSAKWYTFTVKEIFIVDKLQLAVLVCD